MQATVQPVLAVNTVDTSPSLIPGPFILLLLLPAIPLLLFSLGARPPDSSALPFSADDIFQTTALITVAGAVVLCLSIYPGAFEGIKDWVTDVGGDMSIPSWGGIVYGGNQGYQQPVGDRAARAAMQRPNLVVAPTALYTKRSVERVRRPRRLPGGKVVVAHGRRIREKVYAQRGFAVADPASIAPSLGQQVLSDSASRHVKHLREGELSTWYSPSVPHPAGAVFTIIILTFLLIVVVGKLIGDGYDQDIQRIPRWVGEMIERSTRYGEAELKAKVKAEVERRKDRKDEIALLDVELRAVGYKVLETEGEKKKKEAEREKSKGKDSDSKDGKSDDKNGNEGEDKSRNDDKDGKKSKSSGKPSFGSKLKRVFLGGHLADDRDKTTSSSSNGQTPGVTPEVVATKALTGGPGWTPADDAVAQATIAQSTGNAQAMADKLEAQRKRDGEGGGGATPSAG